MVSTVPADVLALLGARASAGTVLTSIWIIAFLPFLFVSVVFQNLLT